MSFLNSLIPSSPRAESACATQPRFVRSPAYEVTESENAFDLTVRLPGVAREGLEITDSDGELRISGKRTGALPEGAVALYRETSGAPFELVIEHDTTVDSSRIEAELKDGLLRLKLAKSESAKPRKINVG